ncbi:unnamed protein product [Mycena citricolor]|uniref:Uncharacterized protein n=1 Tax=Mycena citricolor TaxID=2018698 RepID=A0AAD2HMR7_9AGAR|nr:unnamed protein product [Mycena citricolor]
MPLTLRGFSAWIEVDGEPAHQFLEATDIVNSKVSCWIAGDSGQKFTVHWKDHADSYKANQVTLDGLVVPGRFLFGQGEASRGGVRSGPASERPFTFSTIAQDTGADQPNNKDAGMIVVRIKRVDRVFAQQPANPIQSLPPTVLGKRKAGELCVGFGDEQETFQQYGTTWVTKPHAADAHNGSNKYPTYVSFVFRYRTADWLEAQGIMTEAPEATPAITPAVSPARAAKARGPMRRVSSAPSAATLKPGESQRRPSLITPAPSLSPPDPPKKKLKPTLSATRRPGQPQARRTASHGAPIPSGSSLSGFERVEEEE